MAGLIGISIYSMGIDSAQAASSPHTPVSSDPSYKPDSSASYDPAIKTNKNGAYSKAFEGTGKLDAPFIRKKQTNQKVPLPDHVTAPNP